MSVRVMAMVFEAGPEEIGQHSVMLALADNADDAGMAWPGIEMLARKSRHSERQVTRVLAALEAGGWLTIRRRVRGVRRRCSEYQLNLARLGLPVLRTVLDASRENLKSSGKGVADSPDDIVSGGDAEDVAITDTYTSRTDTVSGGGKRLLKTGGARGHELTSARSRTDITLAEVVLAQAHEFHNHQGTTIETNTTPLPPAAQGDTSVLRTVLDASVLRTVLDASREGLKGSGKGKGQGFPGEGKGGGACAECAEDAVAKVMRECGLSNPRLAKSIRLAMDTEHAASDAPVDWNRTAEAMIAMHARFLESAPLMASHVGPRRFFLDGLCSDDRKWPWDEKRLREARRL